MIFDDTLDPPRLPSDGQFAQLLDYLNFAGVAPDALHLLRERFDDEEQREIYRDFLVKAPTTGAQKSLSCLFGSWDAAFVCGIPVSLLSFFDKCARGFLLRLGGLRIRPLELTRQKGLYDYEEWKANAAIHNALPRKWAFALAWFDEMQGSANEYFQKETEDPLHQALFAFDPSTVLPRPLPNDAAERLAQAKKNLTAQGLCHVLKWRGQFIEQINLGNNPLDLPGLADSLRFLKEPRLYPKENLELGIPSEVIDFQSLFDRAQWISAKEKLQSFLQKVASVGTETDRYTEIAKQEDGYDALKQAYRFFVRKIVGTLFVSLHDIDQYRPLPSTNTEDYHNLPQDAAPLYLAIADKSLNNRERHEVLSPPKLLKDRVLSNDPLGTVVSGDGITLAWELKLGECRIPMPFAPEPSTMQKIQEETISFVPSCRFFLSIQRDKKRTPQSHQLSLRARLLFGTSEDRDRTTRLTVEKFGTRQFLQPLGRLLSDRLTAWLQQLSPFLPLASFAQKPDMSSRQTFSFRADREDLRESTQQKKNFLLTSANLQGFLQQPMQKFFAGASAQLSSSLEDLRGARVNEGLQRQISRSLQKLGKQDSKLYLGSIALLPNFLSQLAAAYANQGQYSHQFSPADDQALFQIYSRRLLGSQIMEDDKGNPTADVDKVKAWVAKNTGTERLRFSLHPGSNPRIVTLGADELRGNQPSYFEFLLDDWRLSIESRSGNDKIGQQCQVYSFQARLTLDVVLGQFQGRYAESGAPLLLDNLGSTCLDYFLRSQSVDIRINPTHFALNRGFVNQGRKDFVIFDSERAPSFDVRWRLLQVLTPLFKEAVVRMLRAKKMDSTVLTALPPAEKTKIGYPSLNVLRTDVGWQDKNQIPQNQQSYTILDRYVQSTPTSGLIEPMITLETLFRMEEDRCYWDLFADFTKDAIAKYYDFRNGLAFMKPLR